VVRVVVPEETEMLILALQELLVKEVLVDPFLAPVVPVAVVEQVEPEQMVDLIQMYGAAGGNGFSFFTYQVLQ
jgi:hypothetical protein